ncbi:hypothetical protein [Halosimplex salinum]|nr:hypothetical protein [Halosimplex salinum]
MATRDATTGMAHLTVVPENYDPAADEAPADGDDVVEATAEDRTGE